MEDGLRVFKLFPFEKDRMGPLKMKLRLERTTSMGKQSGSCTSKARTQVSGCCSVGKGECDGQGSGIVHGGA